MKRHINLCKEVEPINIAKVVESAEEVFKNMINKKVYHYAQETFIAIKTSANWRGTKEVSEMFSKEAKEALNCMVYFTLLVERKVKENVDVDFDACIAYIVRRAIRKALTWDAKPDNKNDLCKKAGDYLEKEKAYIQSSISQEVSPEFAESLDKLANRISAEEENLYFVAKHYANWIEFSCIKKTIYPSDVREIKKHLKAKLKKYNVSKHISPQLAKLFARFSWARNMVRWQGCAPTLNCDILCHMFETAILGWFMAIEENSNSKDVKIVPHQAFLIGLYHDVSEVWTDDIPSVCKNKIGHETDGTIRPATEEQEKEALEKYFYPAFSYDVAQYFKKNIMLEELEDEMLHKFIKKADYFSADFEVFWFIKQGSKNKLFMNILKKSSKDEKNRTAEIRELLNEYIQKIENNTFL